MKNTGMPGDGGKKTLDTYDISKFRYLDISKIRYDINTIVLCNELYQVLKKCSGNDK